MNPIRRLAALAVVTTLLAAACGSNDQSGGVGGVTQAPGGSGAPAGSVDPGSLSGDLTVWAMGLEGTLLPKMADAFMEEYPNVKVSVTPVNWGDAVAKLQTAIGGRQTPDVTQLGTDMMAQFAATGALEPVPSTFSADAFFESAWATNDIDGTVYGVPWQVETRVLYWRTDIAEKAGITEAPATWDEVKAAAAAMQSEGGADWGISLGPKNWQEWLPFAWSNGGDVMAEDGTFTLDSPEVVESLAFYDSFFEEGLTPTSVPEGFDITPAFVAGTHPMMFSGPWHMGLIEEAGGADFEGKWDVAPLPGKDSAPGTSFVGGGNLSVFKDSENKDAAWAFVEFMTRPETQVMWYEEAAALPSVQAAWDDPALADDEKLAVFREQLQSTKAQPAIESWSKISSAINDQMERVCAGNTSPEEGAAAMQQAATSAGS